MIASFILAALCDPTGLITLAPLYSALFFVGNVEGVLQDVKIIWAITRNFVIDALFSSRGVSEGDNFFQVVDDPG